MEYPQLNQVTQKILTELENQSLALFEMKRLLVRQSVLVQNEDNYHFKKTNIQKKRLLRLIHNHKKSLLDFKIEWCKFERERQLQAQYVVYEKIEEIKELVKNIMIIEKRIYYKVKGEKITKAGYE